MSNLLTASRLRSYRACARKHHFEYIQGYRPVRAPEPMRFGSLLHAGLEAWWRTLADDDRRLTAALEAVAVESDAFDRVKAEELLIGYEARWGGTAGEYEVLTLPNGELAVEAEFLGPLINPATGAPSRTWVMGGRIDVIPRHRTSGRTLVVEHKSVASTETIDGDETGYWQRLSIDHQLSIYTIGAEVIGFDVDECLYDVIRKPGIRPLDATPVESRKYLKGTNTLYANQRDHDETPDEFRARLREDIASKPERYFQRRSIPRLQSQIDDFLFDAWQTGKTMREAELANRAPRNPEECLRMGKCSFWEVCTGGHDIKTSPFFRKVDNVHPELTPAITAAAAAQEEKHVS